MLLGYGIGQIFTLETTRRRRMLTILGLSIIAAFAVLRALQVYGDSKPSEPHPELWKTIGDFVDVQKYPASLQFVLITIGPALAFLPVLERLKGPVADFLLAYGRAPLFAYVLHIWLAHSLAMAVGVAMGLPVSGFFNPLFMGPPEGWGFSLLATYGLWLLILAFLYPPTRWFAGVKARRRDWWLGYL